MPHWKSIGQYERYIMFAEAYQWLPSEVDEQDPAILDEINAFRTARSNVDEKYRNRGK